MEKEIEKLALEMYPESFCWYGSDPARRIDDNARDRLIWSKGFKDALKVFSNKGIELKF
jgi:hypothetical protein